MDKLRRPPIDEEIINFFLEIIHAESFRGLVGKDVAPNIVERRNGVGGVVETRDSSSRCGRGKPFGESLPRLKQVLIGIDVMQDQAYGFRVLFREILNRMLGPLYRNQLPLSLVNSGLA